MIRNVTIVILIFISSIGYGQSKKTKKMLQEIKNEWSLDENDKISYKRVVEVPELTKKEIYNKALSFLVENQIENYELITQNDAAGLVLAQGVYSGIHNNGRRGMFLVDIDCKYSIKTEIKEGRVRLTLVLSKFNILDAVNNYNRYEVKVEDSFPVNPIADSKTITGKAFYKSHIAAKKTLVELESAIRVKSKNDLSKKDDW